MIHLKILSGRMLTCSKLHIQDPQIFGANLHDLFTTATWPYGFEHPCPILFTSNERLMHTRTQQLCLKYYLVISIELCKVVGDILHVC
jgi:hypothetical protein